MTSDFERLTAALAGRYRIERELGAGGMATVYLAADLKHDRRVAIKVLRPELAAVLGAERFVQEIKTTAALSHPHILPLFDSGEADGFLYYVMPYMQGETIREKLNRETQLGIEDAVRITTEVADALDYAHRHGVIHRDIKPENVLLHDGRPMVMDFGIALAVSAAAGGRMTETGLSLGTPHYMSPEQATADKTITNRSDVYSLASVLYEMLTGSPPHLGGSAQQIIMKIVSETPAPVTQMRKSVPPNVAMAVAKALEKLPADRFDSAKAFAEALANRAFATAASPGTAAAWGSGRPWWRDPRIAATAAAGIAVGAVLASALWTAAAREDPAEVPSLAFEVQSFEEDGVNAAVADDGTLVYADLSLGRDIFVRSPQRLEPRLLYRHEDFFRGPVVSPDGRWVAFADRAGVYRISTAGGAPDTLALVPAWVLWGADGWIYLGLPRALGRIRPEGGKIDTLSVGLSGIPADVLPDAGVLLLARFEGPDNVRVIAMHLRSGDTATVPISPASPHAVRWSPTGHIVYAHESGALFAVRFDPGRLAVTGTPRLVRDGLATSAPLIDLSGTGTLVYHAGASVPQWGLADLVWLRVDGSTERISIDSLTGHTDARLSHDGTRVTYVRKGRVHVFDLDLGTDRVVGYGDGPIWSPDGRWIAARGGSGSAWTAPSDASGTPRQMAGFPDGWPEQWLPDSTFLAATNTWDVLSWTAGRDTAPNGILVAAWEENSPAVSPDETLIAYISNEGDGLYRAYVRSWPGLRGKSLASGPDTLLGEHDPEKLGALHWGPDSRILYYGTARGAITSVVVTPGDPIRVSGRTVVTVLPGAQLVGRHPDGDRFLVTVSAVGADRPSGLPEPNRLVMVTNWFGELRRRMEN